MRFSRTSLPCPFGLLAAAIAFAGSVSAGTIVVAPGDSLHAAVAAAVPGDTILLMSGTYIEQGTLLVDKPLTIIGAGSFPTSFAAIGGSLGDPQLSLHVDGIASGEEVRVLGISFGLNITPAFMAPTAIRVTNCAGLVSLSDVDARASLVHDPLGAALGCVEVVNCSQVTMNECGIYSIGGGVGAVPLAGTSDLYVEGSTVSISSSTFWGGPGKGASPSGLPGPGGVALHAVDSTVRIARSALFGGDATNGLTAASSPGPGGDGGVGLFAQNSTIELRGGPGNEMHGGAGSLGESLGVPDVGAGASAVHLDASSTLTTTPDVNLFPGEDGDGATTAPVFAPGGTGTWTQLPERLATLRYWPSVATLGWTASTEISGEPFGMFVIGFSLAQSPELQLPGIVGPIVLDLAAFGTLSTVGLDAFGYAYEVSSTPWIPSLAGTSVVFQGVALSPSGTVSVSAPVVRAFIK